jgi:hypothetical protein
MDNGKIHGGDYGYLYRGTYELSGDQVTVLLHIVNHSGQANAVFGPYKEADLALSGTSTPKSFAITGNMVSNPSAKIAIAGEKISDLVA